MRSYHKFTITKPLNQKGQGLVEYLLIVALIGVAAISITRLISQNVNAQFAKVAQAIQGRPIGDIQMDEVRRSHYQKRDMSDFFRGSANREQ